MNSPKLNIVISGIFFPVTAALEYIVRGFQHLENCNVITVGPYPGLQIPWTKNGVAGMVLPDKYDFKPTIALPYNGISNAPISYIESQLPVDKVDLWLDVNAGFYLTGNPKSGIRATFLTDPHVLRDWYNSFIQQYQFIFNPQKPYLVAGERYLPYAADIEWHSPLPGLEKLYDVALIGNTYQQRIELMNRVRNSGKRVFFDLGPAKDDARKIYAQSIIGVNWSSMQDLTARVFELAGLGIVPVLNRVPDLPLFFDEGVHYFGFDTQDQAFGIIEDVLKNPDVIKTVSENARKRIIEGGHTWDSRAKTILEITSLTNKENSDIMITPLGLESINY